MIGMRGKIIAGALAVLAACCLLFAGCVTEEPPVDVSGIGVVTYIDLEGGFYGIIADDGTQYFPTNLPEELKVDGTEVVFAGEIRDDLVTIQQWGAPLWITSIVKEEEEPFIRTTGVVTYIDLVGGFYGIIAEDGRQYLPLNLDEGFEVDGLKVSFEAEPQDVATIYMWGEPVEIVAISVHDTEDIVAGTGTITYIDLEGGFYGIIADDGGQYLPLNLADEHKVDGLHVSFTGTIERDIVTIQQWGQPITIISIEVATSGMAGMPNPAAIFVKELGYEYEIRTGPDGEYGVAILPNGTVIDEWELYRMYH